MGQYIIQIIAFQLFFLLVYDVFLKKETFFNWNRFYLIGTSSVSLILPFIKVTAFKEIIPKDYVISLPEIFIGNKIESSTEIMLPEIEITNSGFSWSLETIFYVGLFIATLLFIVKIIHIVLLIYKNPRRWRGNVLLIKLINSTSAFSFFHYVFLGSKLKEEEQKTIIKHELVHVTQKHTLDLLFFEVQRILFWFNPLVYMYQSRVRSLHEYIADQEALKTQSKSDYYQNLLTQVFETKNVSFINAFFKKSLIKKRIMMLSKSKSKQVLKLKYALLIPIVFGMLIYTSSYGQESKKSGVETVEIQELSFEQLVEKYYQDFLEIDKQGINPTSNYLKNKSKTDKYKYIISRNEHAKRNAYLKYVFKVGVERKEKIEELTEEDISRGDRIINNLKNYSDYLEWKKTDEAKESWENNIREGVLRLVVNDLNKLTSEEKKKYNNKKELISKDAFFTTLTMTDVKGSGVNMYFQPNEFSMANKTDESKAVLINNPSVNIGFDIVDQAPIFPGCENLTKEEQKKCTSRTVQKYVVKNFNTKLAGDLGLKGRQRILTVFKINKEGNIVGVKASAAHPKLEEEAIRVISSLPKMIPGKQKEETVIVPYSLPIIFQVAEKTLESDNNKPKQQETIMIEEVEIPYAVIEEPPMFEDCETLPKDEQRKCTSDAISKHVIQNFNTDLAGDLGLSGRQLIRVMFKIDKDGNVIGILTRAAHPRLEEEAKRVIKSLPKMIPGKQKGEAVIVPYSLPIIFQVADKEPSKKWNTEFIIKEPFNKQEDVIPYAIVEQPPVFEECQEGSIKEQKKCTSAKIAKLVIKSFNTDLAGDLGLEGRQKIDTMFKIDKEGNIVDIKARAAHPRLEEEAIRVIKNLPKMIPGKQKGEPVIVPFSLPIVFQIDRAVIDSNKKN